MSHTISLRVFRDEARQLLADLQTVEHWDALQSSPTLRARLASIGLDHIMDRALGYRDIGGRARCYQAFSGLLRVLTKKRGSRAQRGLDAEAHIIEHAELFFGWDALIHGPGDLYQLTMEEPWWKGGALNAVQRERLEIFHAHGRHTPEAGRVLLEHGFARISQDSYRLRVKQPIMEARVTSGFAPLLYATSLVVGLTGPRTLALSDVGEVEELDEATLSTTYAAIVAGWRERHKPQRVALPHQQFATLTHETQLLSMLVGRDAPAHATSGIRVHPRDDSRLLVYSESLIRQRDRDGSVNPDLEKYLQIPVRMDDDPATSPDLFTALVRALQGMGDLQDLQRRNHVADIPRVVAGIFRAAHIDRERLGHDHPDGRFWDTNTSKRLTRLIGLDDRQRRHRTRVSMVRQWLETIELSRTYTEVDQVTGKRVQRRHTAPIVHRLPDRIELTEELTRGEFAKTTAYLWRIPDYVWQMCQPGSGVENFMLLDARAFQLDSHLAQMTSEPFNLYWTIVQRAYNASRASSDRDRVSPDGQFSPILKTLYEWAGMERPNDVHNPKRKRERLRTALSAMVDHGLLLDWYSPILLSDGDFDTEAFQTERVRLHLPDSFLRYLPRKAFVSSIENQEAALEA